MLGEGARPVGGATVRVVRPASEPPCETTTASDGTFRLACAASGRYAVRSSFESLRQWEVGDVELGPGREVFLNFMLLPASATAPIDVPPDASAPAAGFWTRPLPNPVLFDWQGNAITLRVLAIAVAAASFVLGALTMLALGRRFGVETRRLSAGEVGEMVLNPQMPSAGEHITPIAVAGARGASASVSYGVDEIAAALAARRYGVVFAALVIAPALFALSTIGFAVAMLAGEEMWLFCAMLLVPAGFLITPAVIGVQAFGRRSKTPVAGCTRSL